MIPGGEGASHGLPFSIDPKRFDQAGASDWVDAEVVVEPRTRYEPPAFGYPEFNRKMMKSSAKAFTSRGKQSDEHSVGRRW